jgi:hypothetical protein
MIMMVLLNSMADKAPGACAQVHKTASTFEAASLRYNTWLQLPTDKLQFGTMNTLLSKLAKGWISNARKMQLAQMQEHRTQPLLGMPWAMVSEHTTLSDVQSATCLQKLNLATSKTPAHTAGKLPVH